jgi:hypothetical protein
MASDYKINYFPNINFQGILAEVYGIGILNIW